MSRLTLQLPETLHRQLATQAQREGVSLHQYIVYTLTRQVTQYYTVQVVPEEEVTRQPAQFAALLQDLGQATPEAITEALTARTLVEPEPAITPDVITRLQTRLADSSLPEVSVTHPEPVRKNG